VRKWEREAIRFEDWPIGDRRIRPKGEMIMAECNLILAIDLGYVESAKDRNARMALETRRYHIRMLARTSKPIHNGQRRFGTIILPEQRINILAAEILEI